MSSSNVYVYSLQALRNPLPGDAFVFKIENCYHCSALDELHVSVDETQIVCLDFSYNDIVIQIIVYDFGSFDPMPTPTLTAP